MKIDKDDIQQSARTQFLYCQDDGEYTCSANIAGIYEMLRSIAISLAIIADHLTGTEMKSDSGCRRARSTTR